eukprot:m.19460 g.19460  ORF g.19460 m.19460 type:complete len:450 (-) comp12242_c0_seq1:53-1402(-)
MEIAWSSLPCQPPRRELEEEFGLKPPTAKQTEPPQSESDCVKLTTSMVLLFLLALAAIVLCRQYLGTFLAWLAHLPGWQGPILFGSLFIPVSFPMAWGYIILNLGAGYIYGLWRGLLITSAGASVGALLSFIVCRRLFKGYVLSTLGTYENFKQILRVLEGRQGLKIIAMTRLTPVPFGLQNALFSASKVSKRKFMLASFIGLLPTQLLNAYMGTSLRSMEDVLSGKNSNTPVLICQVVIAVCVTYFVNQRMKREVSQACEREVELVGVGTRPNVSSGMRTVLSMNDFAKVSTSPLPAKSELFSSAAIMESLPMGSSPPRHISINMSEAAEQTSSPRQHPGSAMSPPISPPRLSFGGCEDEHKRSISPHKSLSPPSSPTKNSDKVLHELLLDQSANYPKFLGVKPKALTAGGSFIKTHRRSQSAGPILGSFIPQRQNSLRHNSGLVIKI